MIIQALLLEGQTVSVAWHPFFFLDERLDHADAVQRLHINRDGLPAQCLDKHLHIRGCALLWQRRWNKSRQLANILSIHALSLGHARRHLFLESQQLRIARIPDGVTDAYFDEFQSLSHPLCLMRGHLSFGLLPLLPCLCELVSQLGRRPLRLLALPLGLLPSLGGSVQPLPRLIEFPRDVPQAPLRLVPLAICNLKLLPGLLQKPRGACRDMPALRIPASCPTATRHATYLDLVQNAADHLRRLQALPVHGLPTHRASRSEP
mmetsp:Transcript_61285/g.164883  ORF Transcript_61285/g.164883 Transcript_61285/m.164883 type:complete len:263 (+) Transcript_61285:2907-3695(+)